MPTVDLGRKEIYDADCRKERGLSGSTYLVSRANNTRKEIIRRNDGTHRQQNARTAYLLGIWIQYLSLTIVLEEILEGKETGAVQLLLGDWMYHY